MEKPGFKEAFLFWMKLGFISFGGPAGQIAIMHEYLVDQKKWISNSKFIHALNYCMLLPGPEAQQLAIYIGWLLHGTRGGLAAGILFVLPSMFVLLGLSTVYVTFGNIPWIYAMFAGLKPAVIAIVILALIKIGSKSLKTAVHYVMAGIAFVCIFFFKISFPVIILCAIALAILLKIFLPEWISVKAQNEEEKNKEEQEESSYYLNIKSATKGGGFILPRFLKQLFITVLLWFVPFAFVYSVSNDFEFWKKLSLFFTQAALVTFGGAYAVLPYVAQVSVEKLNWLSKLQMIDGLALGETTPGPLIMVLAFVGFMAGYNHFGNSLAMGTAGLALTTFYTFLPCFFFIFAGAPVIEKTQENLNLKVILAMVTAAVVGIVLNLTIYLGLAVVFPKGISLAEIDYVTLAWVIISFFMLFRFKINMIAWIGISALFGLARYLLIH